MRDILKNKLYFDEKIEFYSEAIEEDEKTSNNWPKDITLEGRALHLYSTFSYYTRVLFCKYSRGDNFEEIKFWFERTLNSWQRLNDYLFEYNDKKIREMYTNLAFDNYIIFLWILSFAVCLEVNAQLLKKTVKLINNAGKDALLDRIMAQMGMAEKVTDNLIHPRPFKPLYESLDADPANKQKLTARFLKNWYTGCRKAFWYDTDRGDDSGYFGYWCFEAALVVKLWGIDDQSFADHPNYPKALVHLKG